MYPEPTPHAPRADHAARPLAPLVLALVLAGALLTWPSPSRAERDDAAVAPRADAPASAGAAAFGLLPPVEIARCEEFPEDGTIGVELVDRTGARFLCGLDGGCRAKLESNRDPASCPRHLFVGATHPARPGAKLLPLWGAEERALLQLLAGAIADSISDAQNDHLLKIARGGDVTDPGAFEFLRLMGGLERRRRMLAAVSQGEVAPAPDAFAYFGLRGAPAVQSIVLDRSGRLGSVAISDSAGLKMVVSSEGTDGRDRVVAWSVDLGGDKRDRLRVPPWGYGERFLLTVLSAALRLSTGQAYAGTARVSTRDPEVDAQALKVAIRAVEKRKDQIHERDRFH